MTPRAKRSCTIVLALTIGSWLLYVLFSSETEVFSRLREHAGDKITLDLIGYNYTNHHIEDYNIDGQNGGIVRVSSPTSGGSGSVCCISLYSDESGVLFVRVRWQTDGCSYFEVDPMNGNREELHHYTYREKYVKVARSIGVRANHLETHFFPDGSVQVHITEDMSLPRFRLSEDRAESLKFPPCKNGEKPA